MKMKTKMTAIFAILMIALMAVGFAYAHWEKIIYINGTVNAADFDVRFSAASTNDPDSTFDPGLKNVVTAVYDDGTYQASFTFLAESCSCQKFCRLGVKPFQTLCRSHIFLEV